MMEELWDRIKVFLVQLTHFQRRNRVKRYGLALALTALIFFLKEYFHRFLGDNSAFLMASSIVAISSWYGGLGPGVFATGLSSIFIYFVFLRTDSAYHPLAGDFVVTAIFIFEGLIISIANEARFQVEEQKNEFIGFVAHELKNPLAAIKGFSGLITRSAKSNGYGRIQLFGEEISNQSDKILELINDLLDVTKIEIGKFSYTDTFFTMNELAKEVVAHQRIIVKNRTIELHGSSTKTLYGDRYRISQVLTNLLTNAIKYSPETKKILVRIKETGKNVLVSVKDYGLGIAKKDQRKIFQRYYRTDRAQKNRSEGIGLGLYICLKIISRHKGNLWVESREGKGATFYFELPFYTSEKED